MIVLLNAFDMAEAILSEQTLSEQTLSEGVLRKQAPSKSFSVKLC